MKNVVTGLVPHLQKKESEAARVMYVQYMGQPVWMPRDYAAFAKEGYTQNAIVFRCIRLIAEAAKSIPLLVYKGDQPVEKHPFLDLLHNPNPFMPESDLLDSLYSYLMIAGNVYLETVLLGNLPRELYVLRPDRMKVQVNIKGYPEQYIYCVGGIEQIYRMPNPGKQMTILHLKTFNPLNDYYGLSPIEPAAKAIDTHNAAGAYNAALLQNMGRPSGALMVEGSEDNQLTTDQFERLRMQMTEQMSGPQTAGRPLLLEGGLKWVPFSETAQDMEFSEGKNSAARDIAQAMGVPPQLLGIPGDNTYSNLKEANVAFYRQTIIPAVTKVCQGMSVHYRPSYGDEFKVWYDIDEVAGLVQEREEKWTMVNASTTLTVNEKREAIGYDERPEGDVVLVPSSMVPLDMEMEDEDTSEEDPLDPEAGDPDEESEEADTGSEGGGSDDAKPDPSDSED